MILAGDANGTYGSSSSKLSRPFGISINPDDILYISDMENHRILVIPLHADDNARYFIGPLPESNISQFSYPHGILATNTSLYVLDYANHRIQNVSLNGTNATTVIRGLDWPRYFHIDENMNIYVGDTNRHQVLVFYPNSSSGVQVAGSAIQGPENHQLDKPYGVYVDNVGSIYIADHNNHRIMKWLSGASTGTRVAGDGTYGSGATQINYPAQILVDTNGYMYISDVGKHQIIRWAPGATFGVCIAGCTRSNGLGASELDGPHSFTFDSSSSLYVTNYGNHRVQKFEILRYDSK